MKFKTLHDEFPNNMPIITVGLEATVGDALRQMRQHKIHHLVVTSPEGVLGVVSDRQLLDKAFHPEHGWNDKVTVKDVYTHLSESLTDSSDVAHALDIMTQTSCTALPIVRSGKLVGIISERDVIRILHNWLRSDQITTEAKSQLILSNPLVANLLQLLAEAGI